MTWRDVSGVVVSGDPRLRARLSGTRRLRDISHLYLSHRPERTTSERLAGRRRLRLGLAGENPAQAEVCANLAVQFGRLRLRTLVLDLDPRLPNVGFRLGLEPSAYLAHLGPRRPPELVRSVFGLRVVEGLSIREDSEMALPEWFQDELQASDCVLLNLQSPVSKGLGVLECLRPHLEAPFPATSTMERAAGESRMFGAWLETARRAESTEARPRQTGPDRLDALLWIRMQDSDPNGWPGVNGVLPPGSGPVHRVVWGTSGETTPVGGLWARIPGHPIRAAVRQPLSALDPEHAASRLYESLAQALLAGTSRKGAADA